MHVATRGGVSSGYGFVCTSSNPFRLKHSRKLAWLALAAAPVAATLLSQSATAATRTWTGGGANGNWSTTGNWGGTAPILWDDLVFAGTTNPAQTDDLGANTVINSITYNAGTGAFTASGSNAIGLATFITDNATNNETLAMPITLLVGNHVITNSGAGAMTFGTSATTGLLTRSAGATVQFNITGGGSIVLNNTTSNVMTNGILTSAASPNGVAYATVGGTDWAAIGGGNAVAAYSAYQTNTDSTTWLTTDNVSLTTDPLATLGTVPINSLRLAGSSNVSINSGNTLTLGTGGLLVTGAGTNTISGGTLKGSGGTTKELVVIQNDTTTALTINSLIADNGAATALTKAGAGTLVLGGNNASGGYTGATNLTTGTLTVSSGATLGTGALNLGGTANAVSLNMPSASSTVASLSVVSQTTAVNTVTIGSGQNLTVTGNVTIGNLSSGQTAFNPVTALTLTGGGAFSAGNGTGGAFVLSNNKNANTGSGDGTLAKLDASGLTSFTLNYGSTGFISIGASATGAGQNSPFATFIGAPTNTFTAGTFAVGLNSGGGNTSNTSVLLGNTNFINADNIRIGSGKTQTQPTAVVKFNTGLTGTPTVTLRGSNGTGRVGTFTIADGGLYTNGSATAMSGTVDFTGGSVDATVTSMRIGVGVNNNNSAPSTGTLNVSLGSFDSTGWTLGIKSASTAANTTTATGIVNASGTATIIAGANGIKLGDTSGTGVSTGVTTGILNITGTSLVQSAGDIITGGGVGTITLNGGTLDLQGHNLGTGAAAITNLNIQAGTLKNVAEINGGSAWSKTTTGTLTIAGTNTFTAPANINAGTLLVSGTMASGSTTNLNGATAAVTLCGTGTLGNVFLAPDSTANLPSVRPGAATTDGSVGTLNMNALTVNGGDLRLDVPQPDTGSHDKIVVAGNATFNGASTISLTTLPSIGFYTLLTSTGLSGTAPTLVLPGAGGTTRTSYDLQFGTNITNQITLNVTGQPAKTLTWTGQTNSGGNFVWDVDNTLNWNDAGNFAVTNEKFFDQDMVTFGNGPTNRDVTLNGTVNPGSVTINNDLSNPYSISGGTISGPTGLTKMGVGSLTLSTSDSYLGNTAVQNGTLILGSSSAIPNNGTLTLGDGSGNSGIVDLNGNSPTLSAMTVAAGAGSANAIVNNSASADATLTFSGGTSTFSGAIQDGTGGKRTFLSVNTGTLILSGPNTYTGNTNINSNSTLQVGAGSTSGSLSSTTAINNSGTLAFNRSDAISVSNVIQGGGALTQQGAGTTTLTGANTYSGATNILGGTLTVGAGGTLGNGSSALVIGTGANTGSLNLSTNSATVGSLTVSSNSTTANTITIGASQALSIPSGNVLVGGLTTNNSKTIVTVSGAGTLAIGNGSGGLFVVGNQSGAASSTTTFATLDASGLANFTANLGGGQIGIGSTPTVGIANGPGANLILGNTNVLTASLMKVGYGGSNGGFNTLTLGTTNTINVDTLVVAAGKGSGTMIFNTGLSSPTMKIRASDGVSRVGTFSIADYNDISATGGATNSTGVVDLTAGSVDAMIGTLNIAIGRNSIATGGTAGVGAFGTLSFSAGTIDASNIILAQRGSVTTANTANATGTLNVSGTANLIAGAMTVGSTGGGGNGTAAGILNLTGGTTTMGGDINDGGDTSTVTLNGGTLDMAGHSFTNIDTLNLQSGTLKSLGNINAAVPTFIKTTAGTLTLDGSNTYGGATQISQGTLRIAATGTIPNTPSITVPAGAATFDVSPVVSGFSVAGKTLIGTGSVLGKINLDAGGNIRPGATANDGDVGTLSIANLTGNGGDIRFDLANPDPGAHDLIAVSGIADFTSANVTSFSLTTIPAAGTYTLLTAGTLTGSTSGITINPQPTPPGGRALTYTPSFNTGSTPKTITLVVSGGAKTIYWVGNVADGSGNRQWDVTTTANWTDLSIAQLFFNADNVVFDSSMTSNRTVTLDTSVSPGSVTVTNTLGNDFLIRTSNGGGSITGSVATLTKSGAGKLTLATNNSYGGLTTIHGGTLEIGSGGTVGSLGSGAVTGDAGAVLRFNRSDTINVINAIGGAIGLVQAGNGGTLQLSGANTYSSSTTIAAGTLQLLSATAYPTGSSLTLGDGATGSGTLDLNGQNATVGGLSTSGTGTSNLVTTSGGSPVLTYAGVSDIFGAVIQNGGGTVALAVTSGSLTLTGNNTYGGNTSIGGGGSLTIGTGGAMGNGTGALAMGGTTSIGSLNLTGGSATVSALTDSAVTATPSTITIASGKTLTVNGNVLIGGLSAASQTTFLSASGAGTLAVGSGSGTMVIGNQAAANATTSFANVDLSGLATFTANFGPSGAIGVGTTANVTAGNANNGNLLLAANSTLTAGTIKVQYDGTNAGGGSAVRLGQTNVINADLITIAAGKGAGTLNFNAALTAPTVKIRGSDGASAVGTFNLSDYSDYTAGGASTNSAGTVNLTATGTNAGSDGSIDALITNLNIGIGRQSGQDGGTATASGLFTFDAGTVTANAITLGKSSGSAVAGGGATGTITVAGTGHLITNGITAGAGSGTGFTGIVNVNGGIVSMGGDIVGAGGVGTLTVNGGTLDMQGHNIGTGAAPLTNVNMQSGTAMNIGEIGAGGVGLTKTTAGSLLLDGTNNYTGNTNVNAGTLTLASTGSLTNSATLNVLANATANVNGAVPVTTVVNNSGTTNFSGASSTAGATRTIATLNLAASSTTAIVTSFSQLHPMTLHVTNPLLIADATARVDLTDNILIAPGMPTDGENLIDRGVVHPASVFTSTAGLLVGYGDAGGGNFELRATLLGDSDLDGQVNVADLANLAGNFGKTAGQLWINGDFDYNGNVNVADLADLAGNFGKSLANGSGFAAAAAAAPASVAAGSTSVATPAAAAAAVPEPTSMGLLVLGSSTLITRRRRRRG
jgi:autotransporter-associated beta strand protein